MASQRTAWGWLGVGVAAALLWLPGCHRSGGGRVHLDPTEVHQGDGFALAIPGGARVRAEPDTLSVDARDGRYWFDIQWHPAGTPAESLAWAWGTRACAPITWDEAHTPSERTWTGGGLCIVNDQRHWAFVVVEQHGERQLLTAYIAEHRRLPYEDAWVDFTRTALSLRAGATPLPAPDPELVRERVRAAAALPPGHLPLPGGGLLSGRVSERLAEVWAAREAHTPPARFAPAEAPASP